MTDWTKYASYKDLRAVIDPADTGGHKNRYINLLHHLVLNDTIDGSLDGKRILDLGCGTGRFTKFLQECGADVTGVDSCREMLDQNKECRTVCSPATNLPFEDGSFDAVLSVWVLQFLNDYELWAAAGEINRVLKPRGIVYLIEQISFAGYDEIYARTVSDYILAFDHYKRIAIKPIAHSTDSIFGIVKKGIVPSPIIPKVAKYHIARTRPDRRKEVRGYTDYCIVMRKP